MAREDKVNNIMKTLKKQIDSRYIIDVGTGAEFYVDATREEFDEALARLIEEGYSFANIPIEQVGGGYINLELISIPGQDWEWFKNMLRIRVQ